MRNLHLKLFFLFVCVYFIGSLGISHYVPNPTHLLFLHVCPPPLKPPYQKKTKIKIKTKDYQTKKQIAMVAALSHSESQGIPFSLSSFICISMLQCVIGLV